MHSVGVLMSKNNLKRGWCSLCVGCCLWACRVVCVCTPGVGVHVMYYECVRTCMCTHTYMYVKLHVMYVHYVLCMYVHVVPGTCVHVCVIHMTYIPIYTLLHV